MSRIAQCLCIGIAFAGLCLLAMGSARAEATRTPALATSYPARAAAKQPTAPVTSLLPAVPTQTPRFADTSLCEPFYITCVRSCGQPGQPLDQLCYEECNNEYPDCAPDPWLN
jgi:hypothetical protein